MVVVVPGLAEGEEREPEQVARLVLRAEPAAAEEVAERVDRVGRVMEHEHADRAAPQHPGEAVAQRAAERVAEQERGDQAADDAPQEAAVDRAHDRIGDQVGRVARPAAAVRVQEQPADVRVREPAQRALHARAVVDVRAVRVARAVGEGVVLAMVGDPRDRRSFDRGGAERREHPAHERRGLEGAVGEHPVEADGHAEAREDVHDQEDEDVVPAQPVAPDLPGDDAEAEDGQDGDRAGQEPIEVLVRAGLDIVDPGARGFGESAHVEEDRRRSARRMS